MSNYSTGRIKSQSVSVKHALSLYAMAQHTFFMLFKQSVKLPFALLLPFPRGIYILKAKVPQGVGKMRYTVRLGHTVGGLFTVALKRGKALAKTKAIRKNL